MEPIIKETVFESPTLVVVEFNNENDVIATSGLAKLYRFEDGDGETWGVK